MSNLDEVFGSGFEDQMNKVASAKKKKFKLTESNKQQILDMAKDKIKPENPGFMYSEGENMYHVVLVKTADDLRLKPMQFGGKSVSFRYGSNWLSSIIDDDKVDEFEPNKWFLLIGFMKIKTSGARTYYNFNCHEHIPM